MLFDSREQSLGRRGFSIYRVTTRSIHGQAVRKIFAYSPDDFSDNGAGLKRRVWRGWEDAG